MILALFRKQPTYTTWAQTLLPFIGLFILAIAVLVPEIAIAQESDYQFGVPDDLQSGATTGVKDIWTFVANVGLYGGLIAGFILYLVGLTQYVRWALIIAFIAGFGDELVTGIAGTGGLEMIEGED